MYRYQLRLTIPGRVIRMTVIAANADDARRVAAIRNQDRRYGPYDPAHWFDPGEHHPIVPIDNRFPIGVGFCLRNRRP